MITEQLMAPGTFSIKLKDNTPLSIRKGTLGGSIMITAARISGGTLTHNQLKPLAIWSGLITRRSQKLSVLGGTGMLGYISNQKGIGGAPTGAAVSTPCTFAQVLTNWFSGSLNSDPGNGITLGGGYSASTTAINSLATTTHYGISKSELDTLAQQTGNEYRFNPNGTIDYGAALFSQRKVLVTPGGGGKDGTWSSLDPGSSWDPSDNIDSLRTNVIAVSADGSWAATANGHHYFCHWAFQDRPLDYWTNNSSPVKSLSNDHTDVANLAQAAGSYYATPTRDLPCQVYDPCFPLLAKVGDSIYLYDPDCEVVDTTNQFVVNGRTVFPVSQRIYTCTWPVLSGMGVYFVSGTAVTFGTANLPRPVTDISDYVEWETGAATTLTLGQSRPLYTFANALG